MPTAPRRSSSSCCPTRGQTILLEPIDPPPAGQSRDLRQGTGRLSQSVQGHLARRQGEVRRHGVGEAQSRSVDVALRPAHHLSSTTALKKATKAIHDAEAALAKKDNPAGRKLIAEARAADRRHAGQRRGGGISRRSPAPSPAAKEKGARQAELEGQLGRVRQGALRPGARQGGGSDQERAVTLPT